MAYSYGPKQTLTVAAVSNSVPTSMGIINGCLGATALFIKAYAGNNDTVTLSASGVADDGATVSGGGLGPAVTPGGGGNPSNAGGIYFYITLSAASGLSIISFKFMQIFAQYATTGGVPLTIDVYPVFLDSSPQLTRGGSR